MSEIEKAMTALKMNCPPGLKDIVSSLYVAINNQSIEMSTLRHGLDLADRRYKEVEQQNALLAREKNDLMFSLGVVVNGWAAGLAAADYSGCCDTPNYCSASRRCTAKDSAQVAATPAQAKAEAVLDDENSIEFAIGAALSKELTSHAPDEFDWFDAREIDRLVAVVLTAVRAWMLPDAPAEQSAIEESSRTGADDDAAK